MKAGVLLVVAVAVLFVLFSQDQGVDGGRGVTDDATIDESNGVERPASAIVAWPDPPNDHDPHVSGRPGAQQPVRDSLTGQTLVYVNNLDRPTIIDLSTGDQREVEVAGPRSRDQFFVEFGNVVSLGKTTVDLPASEGQAFAFSVHRTARFEDQSDNDTEMLPAMAGPSLCLDKGRCPTVPFTFGSFGTERNRAVAIESAASPVEILADHLGAGWWARDGRWTVMSLGENAAKPEVGLPTPMETAVVWVITQSPT